MDNIKEIEALNELLNESPLNNIFLKKPGKISLNYKDKYKEFENLCNKQDQALQKLKDNKDKIKLKLEQSPQTHKLSKEIYSGLKNLKEAINFITKNNNADNHFKKVKLEVITSHKENCEKFCQFLSKEFK